MNINDGGTVGSLAKNRPDNDSQLTSSLGK